MAIGDLQSPLRGAPPERRRLTAAQAVFGLCLVLALGLVGYVFLTDDPFGGEPVAMVGIERRLGPEPKPAEAPAPAPATAQGPRAGVPVIAPGDPVPKEGPVVIRIPGAGGSTAEGPAAPAPALLEDSKFGPLPRIAADGRRPAELYARPAPPPSGKPRVAVLLTGLGLGGGTEAALAKLPAEITLGFNPYADDLDRLLEAARSDGHESVLQIPMEPYDYPTDDPGPQALLTSLPSAANLERLRWAMGRASGYVGLATYMGARFTAAEEALGPVLTEAARRGLLVVDAASGPKSVLVKLASPIGLAATRAAVVIDAAPEPAQIDAELARLERLARDGGAAVAVASPLPVTLDRLESWAGGLAARGVELVPVSAIARTGAARGN